MKCFVVHDKSKGTLLGIVVKTMKKQKWSMIYLLIMKFNFGISKDVFGSLESFLSEGCVSVNHP